MDEKYRYGSDVVNEGANPSDRIMSERDEEDSIFNNIIHKLAKLYDSFTTSYE